MGTQNLFQDDHVLAPLGDAIEQENQLPPTISLHRLNKFFSAFGRFINRVPAIPSRAAIRVGSAVSLILVGSLGTGPGVTGAAGR